MSIIKLNKEDLLSTNYSQRALEFVEECLANPRETQRASIDSAWVALVKIKVDVLLKLDGITPTDDMGDVNM